MARPPRSFLAVLLALVAVASAAAVARGERVRVDDPAFTLVVPEGYVAGEPAGANVVAVLASDRSVGGLPDRIVTVGRMWGTVDLKPSPVPDGFKDARHVPVRWKGLTLDAVVGRFEDAEGSMSAAVVQVPLRYEAVNVLVGVRAGRDGDPAYDLQVVLNGLDGEQLWYGPVSERDKGQLRAVGIGGFVVAGLLIAVPAWLAVRNDRRRAASAARSPSFAAANARSAASRRNKRCLWAAGLGFVAAFVTIVCGLMVVVAGQTEPTQLSIERRIELVGSGALRMSLILAGLTFGGAKLTYWFLGKRVKAAVPPPPVPAPAARSADDPFANIR